MVFPPVDACPDCDFRTAPRAHFISSSARLLRAGRERPRGRAAAQRDEIASFYSI
jgi:hypothetical protein